MPQGSLGLQTIDSVILHSAVPGGGQTVYLAIEINRCTGSVENKTSIRQFDRLSAELFTMSHQENQSPAESIKDVELIEHTQSNCEGEERDLQTNTKSKRKPKLVKPATSKKERKRTQNINAAFADLRKHIPNVPTDTKLSKIKTLKLAMSYIHHLEFQLEGEEHCVTLRERSESTTQTEPTEAVSPVHSRKNSESSYEEVSPYSFMIHTIFLLYNLLAIIDFLWLSIE